MSRYTLCGRIAMSLLLLLPAAASAHHGIGAQFDLASTIEIEGEITSVLWRNPHVRITVGVTDDSGSEALWVVEALSVTALRQKGISDVLLSVGDAVRISGNPARGGETEIYVINLLMEDGREVLFSDAAEPLWSDDILGKSGPRYAVEGDPSEPEKGVFRVWSRAPGTRLFGGPNLDIDNRPLTDAAKARVAAYDPLTDRPAAGECVAAGMPSIVGNPYPWEFVDRGNTMLMRMEHYDAVRTIRLGGIRPALTGAASPLGYSVGHWEGDTLIVETTNVGVRSFPLGIPLSEDLEILEHFTLSEDGSRLDYRIEVTDPAAFLEPVVVDQHYWLYAPDATVQPYECTEG